MTGVLFSGLVQSRTGIVKFKLSSEANPVKEEISKVSITAARSEGAQLSNTWVEPGLKP